MSSLTQDSEREQKVFEQLGPDFGTFGLRPGLDGLQVALVHPHLNLFRHTVGTGGEKRGERWMQKLMKSSENADCISVLWILWTLKSLKMQIWSEGMSERDSIIQAIKAVTKLSLQQFSKSLCQMEASLKWHFRLFSGLTGIYRTKTWLEELPKILHNHRE